DRCHHEHRKAIDEAGRRLGQQVTPSGGKPLKRNRWCVMPLERVVVLERRDDRRDDGPHDPAPGEQADFAARKESLWRASPCLRCATQSGCEGTATEKRGAVAAHTRTTRPATTSPIAAFLDRTALMAAVS